MAHRSISPPTDRPPLGPPGGWRSVADRAREHPSALPAILALVAIAGVAWWFLRPAAPPTEATLPLASTADAAGASAPPAASAASTTLAGTTTTAAPKVVVQAAGEVRQPGLYRLDPGARVDDLIRAAGGLTEQADRDRVNLAAPIADGQRVWLPARGEGEAPPVVAGGGATPSEGASSAGATPGGSAGSTPAIPVGPVNVNTADEAELDGLPGVGPATAQAILRYRDEAGPFLAVDDLLDVPGIGDAKLEQMRSMVTVG